MGRQDDRTMSMINGVAGLMRTLHSTPLARWSRRYSRRNQFHRKRREGRECPGALQSGTGQPRLALVVDQAKSTGFTIT